MRTTTSLSLLAAALLLPGAPASAQLSGPLDQATLDGFEWRSIGPSHMGGRVTDIEGVPGTHTFYIATSLGGIWKTVNAGTTFFPLFTHERVISMGDLAIAPSNPDIVWAGTGEEDSRNSITAGGGIFKSVDGGLTWTDMGLEETQAIGRIVVHPTNPDIVYVAALGHPWGANPERGLYKTTDGGQTWELSKFISDEAGFVDLVMDPRDPDVLFASSWARVRRPYFLKSGGPGSGLWKTTDAGATWTEVAGDGFPTTEKGRIGLAIAASEPDIIYAMVEAAPEGVTAEDVLEGRVDYGQGGYVERWDGRELAEELTDRPRRLSGLYRSEDGGATWEWMNTRNSRPFYYSQIRVDPNDPQRIYKLYSNWEFSDDGGRSWKRGALGHHVDHHAMWIDPNDSDHFIIGSDGGTAQTWDKGGSYDVLNHQALGQFYQVSFDMAYPYRVCGGLQDNGSWCGPSRKQSGQILATDWFNVGGGDGFWTQQDPRDPNIIYSESQGGSMSRQNIMTGERSGIRPRRFSSNQWNERQEEAQGDAEALRAIRAERAADSIGYDSRWNWNTPIVLSPHNPSVVYAGSNIVYRSVNYGEDMEPISPDLSDQDEREIRISTETTGGITPDVTQAETHNTVVALAESPMERGLIYAGTDDGNLWVTENDGEDWIELSDNLAAAGVPEGTWITHVEPSRYEEDRLYVAADNHFRDDFTTYVLVSEDRGRTFRPLWSDIDVRTTRFPHVVREDPVNENLLYMGTDLGIWVSLNRGGTWQNFNQNLPTVPVHDLRIHPRDRELIAGTHGRSVWVVDVAPLQQMTDDVITARAHVFEPAVGFQFTELRDEGPGVDGHQPWSGDNAPYGVPIRYRVADGVQDSVTLRISNVRGETIAAMVASNDPGLHEVVWPFRATGPEPVPSFGGRGGRGGFGGGGQDDPVPGFPPGFNPRPGEQGGDASTAGDPNEEVGGGRGGRGGGRGGRGGFGGGGFDAYTVGAGEYLVTIEAGGVTASQVIRVEVLGPVDPRESVLLDGN